MTLPPPASGIARDAATQVVALQGLPDAQQAQSLRRKLPDAEWQWITRLRQPQDQLRSLLGRALLRHLLAQRLGLPPAQVPLAAGPHGKPQLAAAPGADAVWHFNVAHSGDHVLAAVGPHPVGVDVELCPATVDLALLREVTGDTGRQLTGRNDEQSFCTEWVRREAALKARGLGLLLDPGRLRFAPPGPDWQAVLAPAQVAGLHVRLLWASAAHCAALCLPTPTTNWRLTRRTLDAWLDGPH